MKSSWLLSRARRRWLRCGGTVSPRTSSVIAIANTPSLNATMRLNSTSASSRWRACPPATGSNLGALLSATLGGTFAGSGTLPPVDLARSDRYTPLGYILAASYGHLSQRLEGRSLDGLPGLVGTGARLRHLRDRPGLDPPPSDRGGALGHRPGAGRQGHGPRGRVLFLLLRRDRDRAIAVREGRLGRHLPRLPVRLDESRVGARPCPLGADRMAVHARRVRRRDHPHRADGGEPEAVRLAPAGGGGAAPCAGGRRRARAPVRRRRGTALASAADVGERVDQRRLELPHGLGNAVEGDHHRVPARRLHRPAGR